MANIDDTKIPVGGIETPIVGRVHDVSKDHVVTGANEVFDDVKKKRQSVINKDTDEHLDVHDTEIADRYTKEEVNNIVSRTPETDVIVIEVPAASQNDIAGWLDANTPSGTDPETGRSVRANKLYRVPGPDNTTFSEWAWDGTKYIMLANKDYGIDDEPIDGSSNMAKSGGIRKQIRRLEPYQSTHDLDISDEEGNVITRLEKGHIKTKYFNSSESPKVIEFPTSYSLLVTDERGKAVVMFKNGHIITKFFDSKNTPCVQFNPVEDFSVSDDLGNDIVSFKKGHVRTSKFDSRNSATVLNNPYSKLDIADENNNVIARFDNGHIRTKNFDSRLSAGKPDKFIVNCLGDSITYGHISSGVRANPTWPQGLSRNVGCKANNYGVSATSICDGSPESFVSRLNRMTEPNIDILIIFGGTNDFGDKRAVTLGTINDSPSQGTNFYASFKYLIEQSINKYPMATIVVITPLRRREGDAKNINNISMEDIAAAELNVAKLYGCPVLDLYHSGTLNPYLTVYRNLYTSDGLHPNQTGVDVWLTPQISTFIRNLILYRTAINDKKICPADALTFNFGHYIFDNTIGDNDRFAYTDYIPVEDNNKFEVPYSYLSVGAGYDGAFQYVESYKTDQDYPDTEQTFHINSSVKYIRVNKRVNSPIDFYVRLSKEV